MQKKHIWIALLALMLLALWMGQGENLLTDSAVPEPASKSRIDKEFSRKSTERSVRATEPVGHAFPEFLSPEAIQTLNLIERGGPYPHRQDGKTFQNREQRLPRKARGYYREFTVATPGLSHRGARRIVTGGDPIEKYYYTADHYGSFKEFEVRQ